MLFYVITQSLETFQRIFKGCIVYRGVTFLVVNFGDVHIVTSSTSLSWSTKVNLLWCELWKYELKFPPILSNNQMEDLLFVLGINSEISFSRVRYSMLHKIIVFTILVEIYPRRFFLAFILWVLQINHWEWGKWCLFWLLIRVDSMKVIRRMRDYVPWLSLLHSIDMIYLLISIDKHSLGSWHPVTRATKWLIRAIVSLASWLRLFKEATWQWSVQVVWYELLF